uniref:Uncharacterized protein n=1 Tax=Arundo donax TaxID=35708 RepID=A0A0A9C2N0_ARUDO
MSSMVKANPMIDWPSPGARRVPGSPTARRRPSRERSLGTPAPIASRAGRKAGTPCSLEEPSGGRGRDAPTP